MSPQIDEATVRRFIELISTHACQTINGAGPKGVLQLCRISPIDESIVPSRFNLDDIDNMVRTAVGDALAGQNAYIEARTVRPDLRGKQRGKLEDTVWVFGLVADCDADKNKGGNISVKPSLAVETSPGNFQLWYLFTRAIPAEQASAIGDAMRASSGTDQDTGVITQCYRVPGTPNFPSPKKQARGRITVEPTRIFEHTGRLWDPDDLLAAFSTLTPSPQPQPQPQSAGLEATLPNDLLEKIRHGVGPNADRSAEFHKVVGQLWLRNWSVEAIIELFEKYPNGIAEKYAPKRLRKEVERSYAKQAPGGGGSAQSSQVQPLPQPQPQPSQVWAQAGAQAHASPQPQPQPAVKPTIDVRPGELPRILREIENALRASGLPIFSRAGTLVLPVSEIVSAADGRKTRIARLRTFCVESLMEWAAEAAVFRHYNRRARNWVPIDPPHQLIRMLLVREGRWNHLPIKGVITTPTLRPDGSLLTVPGYDSQTELYLLPGGLQLPPIPLEPSKEEAQEALRLLCDLFSEFSFVGPLDRVVALSGLLTTLVRGSLPIAPLHLIRAHTSGTGKSYLVDVIAAVAIGDICPVITLGGNKEEAEKRLGAILLSGDQLVSLDNCTDDLSGVLLNQFVERSAVKVRVLGQSQMPRCECRTAVFATGNNIGIAADMARRGAICNLDALSERPELRVFNRDTLGLAFDQRASYVAAALTVIRGYLAAAAPKVCGPIASYPAWTRLVRSPLIWLGEPDPVKSMDVAHDEDPERNDMREFADLWLNSDLRLEYDYGTARIIEVACEPPTSFNTSPFKEFLLRVAASKRNDRVISPERLGWWLRRISGQVINVSGGGYRIIMSHSPRGQARYRLSKVS
jgi:hypothetical protein